MRRFFLCLLLLAGATACRRGGPLPGRDGVSASEAAAVFRPRISLAGVAPEERAAYLKEHYWDGFDFSDTLFIASADTPGMLRVVYDYAAICSAPEDPAAIARLMERASVSKRMLTYFAGLAGRILYDPASPLCNDELYLPVLEALVRSPLLDRWEKAAPEHDLRLLRRNRPGEAASDFRYREVSGRSGRLYGLRSEYTLLFFNNPDCGMCGRLRDELAASPLLRRLEEQGRLAVLALYPDADFEAWRAHAREMPREWIYGCDPEQEISRGELYDLRAIPSLYLLDRDKRVLLKDAFAAADVERALREALERRV